ncbi:DNA polymerase IV [Clostridium sp. 'deep sea']|uniref:DNA polymerase Y family protein n=1 Tax=Clostridium sp. 'deep sea' TaxID=2779445 RepID=UPI0018968D96|nr:DNA polymerase IV [Clostridium sp. 'deep sea']QOR36659.1 DNA polymerase IV [Clostridium sp. 'deep sea']
MIVFHVDVNSAYLSWEAVYRLQHGAKLDLRTIPAVVGGSEKSRHGIVLAKSIPAKKYGVKTGEPLVKARQKCPKLVSVPARYELYMKASNALYDLLQTYSPFVQRFSVDECFIDYTRSNHLHGDPIDAAYKLKNQIKEQFGFTVNVGVSSNKLLAKMASDFKKPNNVHTLFPEQMAEKMWPLPVSDLFMAGSATVRKLLKIGITTIGDLAKADVNLLRAHLKSHGELVWRYANGIDDTAVHVGDYLPHRGVGNGSTIAFDVTDKKTAYKILLSLTEKVAMRLRDGGFTAQVVSVSVKSSEFVRYSHQMKLRAPTDVTNEIYYTACQLFDECWQHEPVRHLRVRLSQLKQKEESQMLIMNAKQHYKLQNIDKTVDSLRKRYGNNALTRGVFLHSGQRPILGGIVEEDYQMMSSIL